MTSTLLHRTDDDALYRNEFPKRRHGKIHHTRGVPITLEVPTHVDVFVTEKYYLQRGRDGLLAEVKSSRMGRRNLGVRMVPVKTKKVFTVDFQRPAAGTLQYDLTFQQDEQLQYFERIANSIEDRTIRDITAALEDLSPVLSARATAGRTKRSGSLSDLVIENERVVAYARFDIDACDFEQQLDGFLEYHLNGCHVCGRLPEVQDTRGLAAR